MRQKLDIQIKKHQSNEILYRLGTLTISINKKLSKITILAASSLSKSLQISTFINSAPPTNKNLSIFHPSTFLLSFVDFK